MNFILLAGDQIAIVIALVAMYAAIKKLEDESKRSQNDIQKIQKMIAVMGIEIALLEDAQDEQAAGEENQEA